MGREITCQHVRGGNKEMLFDDHTVKRRTNKTESSPFVEVMQGYDAPRDLGKARFDHSGIESSAIERHNRPEPSFEENAAIQLTPERSART
jgi:hypothetical protein